MIENNGKKVKFRSSYSGSRKARRREKRTRAFMMCIFVFAFIGTLGAAVWGARQIFDAATVTGEAQTLYSGEISGIIENSDFEEITDVRIENEDAAIESTEEVYETTEAFEEIAEPSETEKVGTTRSELRKELLEQYKWNLTATFAGGEPNTFKITNMIEDDIDRLLDEIYDGEEIKDCYELEFFADDSELDVELAVMKSLWEKNPSSSLIVAYDTETDEFELGGGTPGIKLNEEKIREDIKAAVEAEDFDRVIEIEYEETEPKIDYREAKAKYQEIGTFTTHSTDNDNRNTNLDLACQAIDGTILQPGEEFSFNLKTGKRTAEKGYKAAGAYNAGQTIMEEGGGVCQVSTTLYNALMTSGLRATERHAHTYEPSYVTPGEDAMVSYDGYNGPDLKFTNTTDSSLVIKARYEDRTVTCSIIGIKILDDNTEVEMHSEKVKQQDPIIRYVEDPTLVPGTTVVVNKGTGASQWDTFVRVTVGGEVISDERLHTSRYEGHTGVIKRNTSFEMLLPQIIGEADAVPKAGPGTPEVVQDAAPAQNIQTDETEE